MDLKTIQTSVGDACKAGLERLAQVHCDTPDNAMSLGIITINGVDYNVMFFLTDKRGRPLRDFPPDFFLSSEQIAKVTCYAKELFQSLSYGYNFTHIGTVNKWGVQQSLNRRTALSRELKWESQIQGTQISQQGALDAVDAIVTTSVAGLNKKTISWGNAKKIIGKIGLPSDVENPEEFWRRVNAFQNALEGRVVVADLPFDTVISHSLTYVKHREEIDLQERIARKFSPAEAKRLIAEIGWPNAAPTKKEHDIRLERWNELTADVLYSHERPIDFPFEDNKSVDTALRECVGQVNVDLPRERHVINHSWPKDVKEFSDILCSAVSDQENRFSAIQTFGQTLAAHAVFSELSHMFNTGMTTFNNSKPYSDEKEKDKAMETRINHNISAGFFDENRQISIRLADYYIRDIDDSRLCSVISMATIVDIKHRTVKVLWGFGEHAFGNLTAPKEKPVLMDGVRLKELQQHMCQKVLGSKS